MPDDDKKKSALEEKKKTKPTPVNPLDAKDKIVVPLHGGIEQAPDPAIAHFRILGHYRGNFFFITSRGKQVLSLTARNLAAKVSLIMLAPLQWWEQEFPSESGFTGRAVDQAVNFLIDRCYQAGVFRLDQLRGRGAWYDDGRLVIHAGDRLYLDGDETPLDKIDSRFVYEALPPLPVQMDSPLGPMDAVKLHNLCCSLNWEKSIYGTIIAGWITVAAICGALPWRPHVFLTGPSGSGKSWFVEQIQKLLGEFCLKAKGDSSEAGFRQRLQHDSLPVTHDEAEGESKRTAENIDRILGLMRSASADVGGDVIKGGADGIAASYTVRASFLLSAIRVPVKETADATRITVLSLKRNTPEDRENFVQNIQPLALEIASDEYAGRFRARVFTYLPVLRKNVEVFAQAAGLHFGNQRIGDQIGPMIAGAYLLHSNLVVTPEKALAWIKQRDWSDQYGLAEESDEDKCLTGILEASINVQGERSRYEASIAELIEIVAGRKEGALILKQDAKEALGRHGLAISGSWLLVSNTHRGLAKLLRETSWGVGWGRVLKRIDGATALTVPKRFGGALSRGVMVPLELVLREHEGIDQ